MFRNTFQSGFLSILYSLGTKPLQLWAKEEGEGTIKRVTDPDIQSSAIELLSPNIRTTLISCPPDPSAALGIKLPFLVLVLKPLDRFLSFEVTLMDDKNVKRRFRASNYQSTTRVRPFICTMPLRLEAGWNSLLFNLADFTRRAYGTGYVETLRVAVHASCRLRRIYFCDRVYSDDELPPEFKLFVPSKVK
ncbi:hypothetical protein CLOM_g5551 [Closterium sp. NIES-68]|nr:hypothetical protein CLOM_g5551 [Closterium sp. NIES-68]GJP77976.1 hypothetical protein CLOP_g8294 [Closterium sp. NIES-67]